MVNREAMNCEQVWREISNYLDGELNASLHGSMDDHFRTCARCRAVLEGTRNVVSLYGDERMIEVPAGFGGRLQKKLAQHGRVARRRWSAWSAWLVPVAALLLISGGVKIASSNTVPHPMLSEHAQPGRDIPPDMVVVVSAGARDFHVPGCGMIHNKDKEWTLTAKEAQREGYVPCVRCMRKYLEISQESGFGLESNAAADALADSDAEVRSEGR